MKLFTQEAMIGLFATLGWRGLLKYIDAQIFWFQRVRDFLAEKIKVYEDQGAVATPEEAMTRYGEEIAVFLADQPDTANFGGGS